MRRLVEIHKVHVDLFVGDLAVVLRRKMAVWLLQIHKAVDPHFRGTKRVAPGDDTRALRVIIRLAHDVGDLLIRFCRDLIHDLARQNARCVKLVRHFPRTAVHDLEHLVAVQELAAHHEPELIVFHMHSITSKVYKDLFTLCPGCRRLFDRQSRLVPIQKFVETRFVARVGLQGTSCVSPKHTIL